MPKKKKRKHTFLSLNLKVKLGITMSSFGFTAKVGAIVNLAAKTP